MGLLDSLKKLLGKGEQAKDNINVDDLKNTADNLLQKADDVTDKIPGQKDDEVVEKAQEYRNKINE